MTREGYNEFCASLPHATHVVQWGDHHVWKVGGKIFAIAGFGADRHFNVTFKVSQLAFDILREQPGLRPAPHLSSRGMTWIQRRTAEVLDDTALCDYLRESHRLVAAGLTKKLRQALRLS